MSNVAVADLFSHAIAPFAPLSPFAPNAGYATYVPPPGFGAFAAARAEDDAREVSDEEAESFGDPATPWNAFTAAPYLSHLIGLRDPPFSEPLADGADGGVADESDAEAPERPTTMECPLCATHFAVAALIPHIAEAHPGFFAIWSDFSERLANQAVAEATAAAAAAATGAIGADGDGDGDGRMTVQFHPITGRTHVRYAPMASAPIVDWARMIGAGGYGEDGEYDSDYDENNDDPEPTYEDYSALCEEIGDHAVGIADVDAVAPRVAGASDLAARCTICLESMAALTDLRKITRCRHEFCDGCLRRWFAAHAWCPICKEDARGATPAPPDRWDAVD